MKNGQILISGLQTFIMHSQYHITLFLCRLGITLKRHPTYTKILCKFLFSASFSVSMWC